MTELILPIQMSTCGGSESRADIALLNFDQRKNIKHISKVFIKSKLFQISINVQVTQLIFTRIAINVTHSFSSRPKVG